MANWLTYRIEVGDDVLVLADEEAQELIKNEIERSKKADAQTASFLESTTSNGIIRNGKSDPFGQTAIGGMKVVIDEGDLIINGNIKNHKRLTRTYNVMQENRTEVFLYRFDSVTNEITGLWRDCIIQGDIILSREDKTELPLRSSGYYDILICKITIPAGATEITQDMIGDFRQNEHYCGYAKNLLVDIDETLTKSDAAADAAAVGTVISDLRKETRTRDIITEKRITNLEAGLPAERWSVDDSVAYTKEVPENALPFASVDMIGGMTRKCTNLIPFPYFSVSGTANGVTYTINQNGTISFSGKITSGLTVVLCEETFSAGEYYLSDGCSEAGLYFIAYDIDASAVLSDEGPFTLTKSTKVRVYYLIYDGFDGAVTSYPMLNSGATALPYEPYFEGLRSAKVESVESVGVNIWDEEWFNGYLNEHTGEFIENAERGVCSKNFTPVISNETYFFNTWCWLAFYDQNKNFVSAFEHNVRYVTPAFTVPSNARFMKIQGIAEQYGLVYNNDLILHKGSTALPYEPYTRHTLPIPEAVRNLDGYGWGINDEVYNYIDLDKKQFVKRVGRVDMGTLDWAYSDGDKRFFVIPSDIAEVNSELIMRALCAEYQPISYKEFYTDLTRDKTICRYINYLFVRNLSYTDAATFKAAMSGVMLYYELAEPVITDISDLLPDDNLIGVEGGGTVTMVNEYGYDVPSEITYQLKGAEA